MSIKFNVVPRKNPRDLDAPAKYYANIVGDGKTTLSDLAKHASTMSTVSKADILAVLESTFEKIAQDVADGKIVYVGDYFTLQAGGSSMGAETEKEVTAANIKSVKAVFRPGKMIKDALKLATFQKKS
ncbi:DsbA family protein [Epilithonimonas arachidiradicis]|uniref:DNA-binding protein n=1 Tax=Epilithonimonas arachidiradicis TaxID=1617282 RepID=A0A420CPQ2_9FLAO|nr:DsbA family protein [Epilithonimonas arachidiradicis]RKE80400.1 putative histone-like DNA-binding protein [Epilithonimonas arachidiradicis]GGG63985.1 DNA-binding protein [Epilithonimonas arachidiradicis]